MSTIKGVMQDVESFEPARCLSTGTVDGVLTDEHAMSSYGLPVFVAEDGRVFGSAEALGAIEIFPDDSPDDASEAGRLAAAARAAGYSVCIHQSEHRDGPRCAGMD